MIRQKMSKRLRWLATMLAFVCVSQADPANADVAYLHTDIQGTVILETDQSRNVVRRFEYEPYGLPRQAMEDRPGYTGHMHDTDSGLVYMQQRYYDPEVGQFLSLDPVGVDASSGANFNRYWYGNNNPYTMVDPDGRIAETIWDVASLSMSVNNLVGNVRAGNWAAAAVDAVSVAVDAAAVAIPGVPGGAGAVVGAVRMSDEASTLTRYMGPGEARVAMRDGSIPNVDLDGVARPTHLTTDAPLNSSSAAQSRYELPTAPTHVATVPANRVEGVGPAPDGRPKTSGGGSQVATNNTIPVHPNEIRRLDP